MRQFLEAIKNIWKIEELRNRVGLTLGLLLVYRVGAQVVLPGIDSVQLSELANRTDGGGLLGILNAFTGGAFANASVFALGIMPYISVSIVIQILQTTLPYFQRLAMEGESGRAKITQITRYGTVVLAFVQSIFISLLLESYGIVLDPGFLFRFTAVVSITTGTMLLLWLGEKITEHGIGNGISLIIMVGIIAGFPNVVISEISYFQQGVRGILSELFLMLLFFLSLIHI